MYGFPGIDSIAAGNTRGITGRQSDWAQFDMALAFETGCFSMERYMDTVTIRFSFFSDGIQNNKEGWCIDDLAIGWYCVEIEDIRNRETDLKTDFS